MQVSNYHDYTEALWEDLKLLCFTFIMQVGFLINMATTKIRFW